MWLTLAAFAARAAYLLLEPRCGLTGDESSWLALGVNELGRPNRGLWPHRIRLIFYPPVYPYFIALAHRAFDSVRAVLWLQALLGALLVPAVGLVGRRVLGRRVGLLAAAFTAFYPELLWYPAHYWSETVYLLLLWCAIERTLAADADASPRAAAVSGLLWGLATLTRELSFYLVPIVLLWLLRTPVLALVAPRRAATTGSPAERASARRKSLSVAAALATATLLTVAPWTLRNAIVYRAFIPVSTMGGLNLWQGNTSLTHTQIYELLATKGGPVEQDRFCREMAWREIAARQPGWLLAKLRSEMPEFWKPSAEVLDHLGGREACGKLPARRLIPLEIAFVAPYLVVLGLCLVGVVRLRWNAETALLLALLAAYNGAHVAAYSTTRFRLPVLPVVFVLAAAALVSGTSRLPLTRGRWLVLVGLALAALATLAPGLDELVLWQVLSGRSVP